MAWTAPMTAVAGATFTASQFNQFVRDNLNETAPAKATAPGQIFVATGANAIAARSVVGATVATAETTTSATYADLTTVGPSVTLTTGTSALVWIKAGMENATANASTFMGFAVSGASSVAAGDATAINIAGQASATRSRESGGFLVTGLVPGSNQFTAKYKVSAGTGTAVQRDIIVMGL